MKTALILMALLTTAPLTYAIVPVTDAANLEQTTITALQEVAQVAKQVEQYQLQLKQYEDMIKNSATPSAYIWDAVNDTMNKLVQATDTLNYYKQQAGNLDNYLNRYQDVDHYAQSPCFGSSGCTAEQWQQLQQTKNQDSAAIKRTNDAMFKGLDQQNQQIQTDTAKLSRLQSQAGNVTGRLQALQAANQLASAQANQLLQIRQLLITQQTAQATQTAAQANNEAIATAADLAFRKTHFEKSDPVIWTLK